MTGAVSRLAAYGRCLLGERRARLAAHIVGMWSSVAFGMSAMELTMDYNAKHTRIVLNVFVNVEVSL